MNLRIHVISKSVVREQQGRESSKTKDAASEIWCLFPGGYICRGSPATVKLELLFKCACLQVRESRDFNRVEVSIYRRLWKKRHHQLTLFLCVPCKKAVSKHIPVRSIWRSFSAHIITPVYVISICEIAKKMQDFFACFARHQIRHINHVQKNIQRKEEKKWQKEKQKKTQNRRDWNS